MDTPDLQLSDTDQAYEQREREITGRRQRIHDLLRSTLRREEQSNPHAHEQPREIGRWLDIVVEIADFWKFTNAIPFVHEVVDWAFTYKREVESLSYLYDYYRTLSIRTPASLDRYFEDAYEQTMKFLVSTAFLKRYPLVKVTECSPLLMTGPSSQGQYTWTARYLMGRKIEGELRSIDAYTACPESQQQVLSIIDTAERFHPRLLPLTPLSVFTAYPLTEIDLKGSEQVALLDDLLDDSVERGLRYRFVSLNRNVTPIYVTLQQYVDLLSELLKESRKPKLSLLPPDAGWQDVRKYVHRQNTENRNRIGGQKYQEERYLERVIDEELRRFLASPQQGMLIVGDAGVGKTNLLCHWSAHLENEDDTIVLLHDCRDFVTIDLQRKDVEQRLVRDLGLRPQEQDGFPLRTALEKLNAKRVDSDSAQLIFLFDALNEHPEAHKLLELLALYLVSADMPSWLKIVITCRSEPWERSLKYRLPPSSQSSFYKFGDLGEPVKVFQFSDDEAKQAYNEKYRLRPEFSTLPAPLQKLLTDPLMLGLAHRIYSDSGIPADLHQNQILREYVHTLIPESPGEISKEQLFLTELLKLMHENEKTEVTLTEAQENPILQEAFGSQWLTPGNPYLQLISDLLRDSGTGIAVTFRYERVFEFALAEYVLRREAEEKNG
jgi:hypothetical protein